MAVADPDAPGPTLTKSQAERRARVVDAARALASEGGYDAVQMRAVADRAGVALGTIYRYFSSKDDLLAAVLVTWASELEASVLAHLPDDPRTVDRLCKILHRATGEMEEDPNLARAVLTAMTTTNEQVRESQREAAELMWRVQVVAFQPDFDQTTGVAIVRILGQVWFAALMGWVNGWRNITKVGDELEFCARFLLEPYD